MGTVADPPPDSVWLAPKADDPTGAGPAAREAMDKVNPVEVFYSYAHEDEPLLGELLKHLDILKRLGVIRGWHDRKITAGSEWRGEIDWHLDAAGVILLLVSPDFIASDYCYDREMKRALKRHDRGEARVIPVLLRSVADWQDAPFGKLGVAPTDGQPVTSWPNRDEAFADVACHVRRAVKELSNYPRDDQTLKLSELAPPTISQWRKPIDIIKVAIPRVYRERVIELSELTVSRMQALGFSDEAVKAFHVSFGEATENAFEYGCTTDQDSVTFLVEVTKKYAGFSVINPRDRTFDLQQLLQDTRSRLLQDPRSRRGRGLLLISELADQLSSLKYNLGIKAVFEKDRVVFSVSHVKDVAVATLQAGILNRSFKRRTIALVEAESEWNLLLDFSSWETGGTIIYTIILDAEEILSRSKKRVVALLHPNEEEYCSPIQLPSELVAYDVRAALRKLGRSKLQRTISGIIGLLANPDTLCDGKWEKAGNGVPWNRQINQRFLYRPMLDFRIVLEARNPGRRCLRQYAWKPGPISSASGSSRSTTAASAPPGGRGALSSATKRRPGCSPGGSSGGAPGGAADRRPVSHP